MSRVLIGYDIHDSKRRRRALAHLREQSGSYLYSFFDCRLSTTELEFVVTDLVAALEPAEDGVMVAHVAADGFHALGQRFADATDGLFRVV